MFNKVSTTGRPIISVPKTAYDWVLDASTVLAILIMFIILISNWGDLPEQVPMHFNAQGLADRHGGKWSLLFFVLIPLAITIMLTLMNRNPHHYNYLTKITEYNALFQYRLAQRMLRWVNLIVVLNFTFLLQATIDASIQGTDKLQVLFVFIFIGSLFLPMIIYFYLSSKS
jgi:uncharacterized membrane protein